ncbi:TonB-dependent receptor [Aquirufa sp. ROCK2-A2]
MRFRLQLFLLIFCIGLSLKAQNTCQCTLKGTVISKESNQKIANATVYLKGTKWGTKSDAQGNYQLKNICTGTYELICELSSFDKQSTYIQIKEENIQNFDLSEHDEHLQEIIVSGKKSEAGFQMTGKLSEEERAQKNGLNLGEMLKGISGVQSLQTGSTISKPVIHGMHSSRVIILNQGVRQEGQQWGSEHAPEIDPFVSKNIQIIKGPAGLRYGGDAIGGIVLMEPNALPDTTGIQGEIQNIYFTNGRQWVLSGSLEGGIANYKGWGWRVQGTIKDGGNIQTANYNLANTGVKEENFSAQFGYKAKIWGSELFYSRFHNVIGIYLGSHIGNVGDLEAAISQKRPSPIYTPDQFLRIIDRPNQDVTHDLLKWKNYFRFNNGGIVRGTFAFQNDERFELDVLRAGKNVNNLRFQLDTFTGELMYDETNTNKTFKGQFGITLLHQGNITSGKSVNNPTISNSLLPNYFQDNIGLFGIEKFTNEKYELEAGLRFDAKILETHKTLVSYSGKAKREEYVYHGFSGSIGGKYHWNDHFENQIILARAFRAPSANELFSYGVHHGAGSFEIGDPFLKGETATNLSLNSLYTHKNWEIEIGLYHNFIQNFIYLRPMVRNGEPVYVRTVRGVFPGFEYQQINATFQGIDGKITYQLNKNWSLSQKTSIVRAFDVKNNQYIVNIPADRYEYQIRYQFNHSQQYISLGLTDVSRQTRVEEGSDYAAPPKGYQLLEMNWGMKYRKFDVGIRVSNALNSEYRDYLNRFRYFTDDQGRNISLRANYRI